MVPEMTKVNWHKINECGNDNLKKAQKILNDNPKLNLSKKLFTTAIDCEMTGKPLISTLSHEVIEYATKNKDSIGVISSMIDYCNNFVYLIKSEEDFIEAYILDEEVKKIWIVIKEACFNKNKKYLKKAREFKKNKCVEFELTIFDERQINEMREELEFHIICGKIKK